MRKFLILAALLIVFWLIINNVEKPKAYVDFVREDVKHRYPDAQIIEIIPLEKGIVKAIVVGRLNSTCPYRVHLYYQRSMNLPERPEWIVKDCHFYVKVPPVLYPEQRIILSHLYLKAQHVEHVPPADVNGSVVCWHNNVCTNVSYNGDVKPLTS